MDFDLYPKILHRKCRRTYFERILAEISGIQICMGAKVLNTKKTRAPYKHTLLHKRHNSDVVATSEKRRRLDVRTATKISAG